MLKNDNINAGEGGREGAGKARTVTSSAPINHLGNVSGVLRWVRLEHSTTSKQHVHLYNWTAEQPGCNAYHGRL